MPQNKFPLWVKVGIAFAIIGNAVYASNLLYYAFQEVSPTVNPFLTSLVVFIFAIVPVSVVCFAVGSVVGSIATISSSLYKRFTKKTK